MESRDRKEMEAKKNEMENNNEASTCADKDDKVSSSTYGPKQFATNGVFFQCPMINCLERLPAEEWPPKIEKFIQEQMNDDPVLQSILLIKHSNCNQFQMEECIKSLVMYIEQIIHDKEEKHHKIRMTHNTFKEKVFPVNGAIQFLKSIGFIQKKLMHNHQEEDFLIFSLDPLKRSDTLVLLQNTINDLESKHRILLVLDRNAQVLLPSQLSEKALLPPEFYATHEASLELKRNELESEMNSKTENKHKSDFTFCLIRVRFPDNFILQGTFKVNERLSNLLDFVKESIFDEEQPFKLSLLSGHSFDRNEDKYKTLSELNLIPIITLQFSYKPPKMDVKAPYLKRELLSLVDT